MMQCRELWLALSLFLLDYKNQRTMPIWKRMKGQPSDLLAAKGLMYQDWDAITACQRECNTRLGMTIQIEQEAYLSQHPEIKAMLEIYISKMAQLRNRKDILKKTAEHFTRPAEELDKEIRDRLKVPYDGPYTKEVQRPIQYKDAFLIQNLKDITVKNYPPEAWSIPTPDLSTLNTPSSTFLSIVTSDTTLPTPEPVRTPEPTISEIFHGVVSNTVDKAIYSRVDDRALRFDTAYVELTKCIEMAMEIPVIDIKEDIAGLFYNAYKLFELNILEKERIAAEIAWENRMRKKLKRTLRRMNNFKGYETPPTPKSEISSHESYKKPPPRPCICHPQFHYNRYPKDRFGIYQPREEKFKENNVTATPPISIAESIEEELNDEKADTRSVMSKKSMMSKKSVTSKKSTVSKKTTTSVKNN